MNTRALLNIFLLSAKLTQNYSDCLATGTLRIQIWAGGGGGREDPKLVHAHTSHTHKHLTHAHLIPQHANTPHTRTHTHLIHARTPHTHTRTFLSTAADALQRPHHISLGGGRSRRLLLPRRVHQDPRQQVSFWRRTRAPGHQGESRELGAAEANPGPEAVGLIQGPGQQGRFRGPRIAGRFQRARTAGQTQDSGLCGRYRVRG